MKSLLQKWVLSAGLCVGTLTAAPAQVLFDANGVEPTGSPMWVIGPVVPQNNWVASSVDAATGHLVTVDTILGAQTVTPASGIQMLRSISSALATVTERRVWVNLLSAYQARTAGNNTVQIDTDIFLPSANSTSTHRHGLLSLDTTGTILLGGFLTRNNDRAFQLFGGGQIAGFNGVSLPGLLPRDQWVHVTTMLDYDSNRVEVYINGRQVAFALASDNIFRTGWPLTTGTAPDYARTELYNVNVASQTTASNFFTDNYTVTAVSSANFSGKIRLQDVPNFADALSPVSVALELRDADGTSRGRQVITRLTPDADLALGSYSVRFHDVPPGDYKLVVKGARHLSRMVDVTVSGDTTAPTVTLKGGDANNDDSADVLDLDLMIQAFDTVEGDPGYNPGADFDYSDSVDVLDLDILIRNFDQVGEGS